MEMPYGYRWALPDEKGRPDAEWVFDGTSMDLAVPWDCMVEFGMEHDHDPEKCEQRMARLEYQEDFDNEQAWTSDHWM